MGALWDVHVKYCSFDCANNEVTRKPTAPTSAEIAADSKLAAINVGTSLGVDFTYYKLEFTVNDHVSYAVDLKQLII